MAPPKQATSRKSTKDTNSRDGKKTEKKTTPATSRRKAQPESTENDRDSNQIDISATIPITLQQLLLNVFSRALLPNGSRQSDTEESELDTKTLIQTIKSHLYNRDFDSAFTDADESLLRAYALRWSAARALGYAGLFKSLLKVLTDEPRRRDSRPTHVVCIGGGAGAEIVALATAWRDLIDEGVILRTESQKELSAAFGAMSLENRRDDQGEVIQGQGQAPEPVHESRQEEPSASSSPGILSVTAVDIADWSAVVKRLSSTIVSPTVAGSKSHPPPLLYSQTADLDTESSFSVDFKRLDVLTLSDDELTTLLRTPQAEAQTNLVSLMFTLNELFSTSMAKATSFLLRTTDALTRNTILLVVDSPGSYSTLKLKKESGTTQERQYPMKFLLDHTLLSVAKGKWEKIYEQDSRWWRRDSARLVYDVGEGAGLEDMRYQIHVYRRV